MESSRRREKKMPSLWLKMYFKISMSTKKGFLNKKNFLTTEVCLKAHTWTSVLPSHSPIAIVTVGDDLETLKSRVIQWTKDWD